MTECSRKIGGDEPEAQFAVGIAIVDVLHGNNAGGVHFPPVAMAPRAVRAQLDACHDVIHVAEHVAVGVGVFGIGFPTERRCGHSRAFSGSMQLQVGVAEGCCKRRP